MTSSLELKKRLNDPRWQLPQGVGYNDIYIESFLNCRPGYSSAPIGDKPGGVKICIRDRNPDGSDPRHISVKRQREYFEKHGATIDESFQNLDETKPRINGYHKYQTRMYDVRPETSGIPVRTHSHTVCSRRPPHEERNLSRDLIKQEIRYDGTGINPLITPAGINETGNSKLYGGGLYREYGISIVKKKPEFDITRLDQPSSLYKKYQENSN